MLDEHFRSDPHIIDFSNKMFYDNQIRIMTHKPKMGLSNQDSAIQVDYVKGKRVEGAATRTGVAAWRLQFVHAPRPGQCRTGRQPGWASLGRLPRESHIIPSRAQR